MIETKEEVTKKNLVRDFDREEKQAFENLNTAIDKFIADKKMMTPLVKWDAFHALCKNFDFVDSNEIMKRVNKRIRVTGQRWDE